MLVEFGACLLPRLATVDRRVPPAHALNVRIAHAVTNGLRSVLLFFGRHVVSPAACTTERRAEAFRRLDSADSYRAPWLEPIVSGSPDRRRPTNDRCSRCSCTYSDKNLGTPRWSMCWPVASSARSRRSRTRPLVWLGSWVR